MSLSPASHFALGFVVLLCGCASTSGDSRPNPVANEIGAVCRQMEANFARRDMKSVAAVYADDAILLGADGVRVAGRQAIDAYWASIANPVAWELETLGVEGFQDLFVQRGRSRMTTRNAQGLESISFVEFSVVWRREPSGRLRVLVDTFWPPSIRGD